MDEVSRDKAWDLLCEHVQSESLRKHCLAVEAGMRAYAPKHGGDEEFWGVIGLLHDFDYEKYPEVDAAAKTGHPFEGSRILRERDWPEEVVTTILSHADYSGVPRETPAAKCLFALDEFCGFVVAVAHMRPERFQNMEVASVEKKLKKKDFAAKVSRADIDKGIAELGVDRAEHIGTVIEALRDISDDLFPKA
jgi:putative nucleotidyltransferase with HDIG domain